MVKKETVGKIQLWIGVILLIIGIFGAFFVYNFSNSVVKAKASDNQVSDPVLYNLDNIEEEMIYLSYINWYIYSFITIALSILFITQGLANKSENT